MKVRATAKGLFNDQIRNEGEEFEVPHGAKASWWEPVDKETKADAEPEEVKDKPARKKRAKKKS